MAGIGVALQLYTVRDDMATDLVGTLKKVASIGYQAVELAGLYGKTPAEFKAILDDLGLTAASIHEGYDGLTQDLRGVIERSRILECEYIVCPGAPGTGGDADLDTWKKLCEQFNYIGRTCKDTGHVFAYHNHAHEFAPANGSFFLKYLVENTHAHLVKLEVDAGWAYYAGVDPAEWIASHKGRVPLIHAKDHSRDDKEVNTPVGEGAVDWKAVFAAAEAAGTKWAIVEEDRTIRPALESIAVSLRNLEKMQAEVQSAE